MNHRKFGKYDFKTSVLGFGCMRLPVIDNDYSKIDEREAIKMVRYAIDNGVNYIDTAYPYHKGNSELFVAKALKDGYREKVYLATKSPVWLVKSHEDFDKYLNEQLSKLETDHIDMYLLHALNKDRWTTLKEQRVFDFIRKALSDGRIRHIGFSFHDDLKTFKDIVDSYDWDFCQIQFNYMDEHYQAGIAGLRYAHKKNMAVIVMEPIKGGKLANRVSKDAMEIFKSASANRSAAEWALRWVWSHPEVTLLLSGMSNMEQVVENVKIASNLNYTLKDEEMKTIDAVRKIYKAKVKVDCTSCGYCVPCPNGVAIPTIFNLYNDAFIFDNLKDSQEGYKLLIDQKSDASQCVECGQCESVCPQHLSIIKSLKNARATLEI